MKSLRVHVSLATGIYISARVLTVCRLNTSRARSILYRLAFNPARGRHLVSFQPFNTVGKRPLYTGTRSPLFPARHRRASECINSFEYNFTQRGGDRHGTISNYSNVVNHSASAE